MNEKKTPGFHYGYLIVIACCVLMLGPCCFSFNTAGIFYDSVSKELGFPISLSEIAAPPNSSFA